MKHLVFLTGGYEALRNSDRAYLCSDFDTIRPNKGGFLEITVKDFGENHFNELEKISKNFLFHRFVSLTSPSLFKVLRM